MLRMITNKRKKIAKLLECSLAALPTSGSTMDSIDSVTFLGSGSGSTGATVTFSSVSCTSSTVATFSLVSTDSTLFSETTSESTSVGGSP